MQLLNNDIFSSIRFKLLASLFIALGCSITISLFGIWSYEKKQYVQIAQQEAMQAGRTIQKSLWAAMLANDQEAIQETVNEVHDIVQPSIISIVGNNGKVSVSSNNALTGTIIDRDADPSCTVCHTDKNIVPQKNAVFLETEKGLLLRNIIKIVNKPPCYKCHSKQHENLGILVYDADFTPVTQMLRTVASRTILTGLFTFVGLIIILSLVINRYVHSPIKQLVKGTLRVGRGDFQHWVQVDVGGEFQEMADSFNIMSRAIGRYIDEVKQKNRETKILYGFSHELSKIIEWNRVKKTVVNLLYATFPIEQVSLVMPHETKDNSIEIAWRQKGERRYGHDEYHLGDPGMALPGCLEKDIQKWLQGQINEPLFTYNDSKVLVPLFSGGQSLGLICVQTEGQQPFNSSEKHLFPALADHVAITLANARSYHMAITDSLTGLYTKRYFQTKLKQSVMTNEGTSPGFCVLLLDIDHFKQVNDTYGHPAGDEVLMQLAGIIKENIRHMDIACRYGGEEFVVLLPEEENLQAARETAERLRSEIESFSFTASACPPIYKTVSIGLACSPLHGISGEEIVKAADIALYEAKNSGRNQVKCIS